MIARAPYPLLRDCHIFTRVHWHWHHRRHPHRRHPSRRHRPRKRKFSGRMWVSAAALVNLASAEKMFRLQICLCSLWHPEANELVDFVSRFDSKIPVRACGQEGGSYQKGNISKRARNLFVLRFRLDGVAQFKKNGTTRECDRTSIVRFPHQN